MSTVARIATITLVSMALFVACSSSSSDGGGGTTSVPSCKGATGTAGPGSAACNSCVQSKCSAQLSSYSSSCGAYLSCYSGCNCSDASCLMGCLSKIDKTCESVANSMGTCVDTNCKAECNDTKTDAGTGG